MNIFLDLLHYIPYIKDEKVELQLFLGCLPLNFRERIEFDMPKTLDTTLHKDRIFYEHRQLRKDIINIIRDMSRTFSDNHKPGFNPPPYRKQNNNFPTNKNFNQTGTKPYVPAPNANKPAENGGASVALLQIKCWKFQEPHYDRDCKNKTNGVLNKLQEEPTKEDIAKTPWIYAALDGRQEDH